MADRLFLSVVIPVYNEEESLLPLYKRIRDACDALGKAYEIVFVDDGSQDQTLSILERLHDQDSRVKVIRFRKNYGQTAAMAAGFRLARGEIIVSMDGDLQNDPADIPRLLAKLEEGYDVVCGWRKERKDKFLSRRLPSIIANWLIGKVTGVPIHDNGCSLKAYRAAVIKRTALYSELHRFIPAMSTLTGAKIAEIVVRHHPRRFGKSKYGISRIWRVLLDIVIVKMLTGFAARPALWFGVLSLPALLVGTVFLLGMAIPGASGIVFPALSFLCFSLAGHLLALGVLGEMVLKTGDFQPERMIARVMMPQAKM
ncbi:MAG: glycosyltransferase [Nitrospinota bacterium]|nr:MAG: glycosyltransferase [Nitrospinota bacterium]